MWHIAWTGSAWTSWETLKGLLVSAPAAASWGADRLDVFAVQSPDNSLWHNRTQAQIKGFFGLNSSLSVFRPKDVLQKPVNSAVIELNHTKNNIVTGR
jgi:hypothetical protein